LTSAPEALLLIDHGSRRPEAHAHLEQLAERVRQLAPELRVEVGHMELAEPDVAACLARCAASGVRRVAILPLFLVPGRHLEHDLPALISEAAARHPELEVRVLDALGADPGLAALIAAAARRDG
jgi:sirohydrochlorin ferrochelatase